jgi:hypothetical protein
MVATAQTEKSHGSDKKNRRGGFLYSVSIPLCLDVCIEARYWIFGWCDARISGLRLFGWFGYSACAFGLNIEAQIFCLRRPSPNVLG